MYCLGLPRVLTILLRLFFHSLKSLLSWFRYCRIPFYIIKNIHISMPLSKWLQKQCIIWKLLEEKFQLVLIKAKGPFIIMKVLSISTIFTIFHFFALSIPTTAHSEPPALSHSTHLLPIWSSNQTMSTPYKWSTSTTTQSSLTPLILESYSQPAS